jgi:hypothetical protein
VKKTFQVLFSPLFLLSMLKSANGYLVQSANSCVTPDLLVDDFAIADVHNYQGATRNFNLLGGDYGAVGLTAEYSTTLKHVTLTSTVEKNFWFAKFDLGACFDLSPFNAIQFDMVAPVDTNAIFTLTQKSVNCVDRLVDSQYMRLSNYVTPNGQKQTVTMPLTDFAKNLDGNAFDFKHLKDWTLNSLLPVGVSITISNLMLVGDCRLTPVVPPNGTVEVTPVFVANMSSALKNTGFGALALLSVMLLL